MIIYDKPILVQPVKCNNTIGNNRWTLKSLTSSAGLTVIRCLLSSTIYDQGCRGVPAAICQFMVKFHWPECSEISHRPSRMVISRLWSRWSCEIVVDLGVGRSVRCRYQLRHQSSRLSFQRLVRQLSVHCPVRSDELQILN